MSVRLAAAIVITCLCLPTEALRAKVGGRALHAQSPPDLSKAQRELLQALVTAVDTAAASPSAADDSWLIHVLRASDGSHYVAFSITPPPASLPDKPALVYVRLATAGGGATTLAERSLVSEWLRGSRIDPRLQARSGMAIGEMPPMGAGAIGARGPGSVGSADLQAMDLQRERAKQRRDDDESKRRAALEGTGTMQTDRLPFEDFELTSTASFADGTRTIQRALTAGPGAYDLFVAWADATQPAGKARVHVARQSIQLSPASPELGLSSVILADRIGVRATPYPALEQRGHPYTVGVTEITPARDTVFTPDERLAAAFQIVNPAPGGAGKPDLVVNLRIVRVNGLREDQVASLSPLTYNAESLPADFDTRLGHPVIAAMAVPLTTIPRGQHRLVITVEDRISKTVASSRVEFSVVGSATSLLGEAPPLGPRFDRLAALDPAVVTMLVDRMAPPNPSPALSKAMQSARAGRYADLLLDEPVAADEQGIRAALTGLALLSIGDFGAIAQFERALAARLPPAPLQYFLGVARAAQNRDAEAITAWRAAVDAGLPRSVCDRWLADAYLRQRNWSGAADRMTAEAAADVTAAKTFAATRIATRREPEAVAVLDRVLAAKPDDLDARWLRLHALYAEWIRTAGPRDRVIAEAQRYIGDRGPHAALAGEWLAVVTR
jgi:hypothetical protein